MIKITTIVIAIYLLYYAANIIFDLFLNKGTQIKNEETEVFSLADFGAENQLPITTVGIEDVENLNTPKSFNKKELIVEREFTEDRPNIDFWRDQFENEQNIDSFEDQENKAENSIEESETKILPTIEELEISQNPIVENKPLFIQKSNGDRLTKILNLAESTVQLVKNINGHKVYQSTLL